MSTNNQLVIIEKKDGFYLYENPCVDNDFKPSKKSFLNKAITLREAIRKAQAYCNIYPYVEYGYVINLLNYKPKKNERTKNQREE